MCIVLFSVPCFFTATETISTQSCDCIVVFGLRKDRYRICVFVVVAVVEEEEEC